jgi:hypothetical protein
MHNSIFFCRRQSGIVAQLFSGAQCSSCDLRFPPERYSLECLECHDWHFRQNRRDHRDLARRAPSRKWYYDVSDWIQYEIIEDLKELTLNESAINANLTSDDDVVEVQNSLELPAIPYTYIPPRLAVPLIAQGPLPLLDLQQHQHQLTTVTTITNWGEETHTEAVKVDDKKDITESNVTEKTEAASTDKKAEDKVDSVKSAKNVKATQPTAVNAVVEDKVAESTPGTSSNSVKPPISKLSDASTSATVYDKKLTTEGKTETSTSSRRLRSTEYSTPPAKKPRSTVATPSTGIYLPDILVFFAFTNIFYSPF